MSDVLTLVRRVQEEMPDNEQVSEFAGLVDRAAQLAK